MADQPPFTPAETQARLAILRAEQVALRSELQGLLDEDTKNGAAPPSEAEWNEPKTLPNAIRQCDANIQALDDAAATSRRLASLEATAPDFNWRSLATMLGYLAREMRRSNAARISVPQQYRDAKLGGMDRFDLIEVEAAALEAERLARAKAAQEAR